MAHTPHELADDFPDQADRISSLKASNAHFAKMAEEYHKVNRQVHRGETDIEPLSDAHMTDLRRKRMQLKDQIAVMLRDAA